MPNEKKQKAITCDTCENIMVEKIETSDDAIINKFIAENYGKIAILLGMGTASGLANIDHGALAMLTAGLKQLAYSGASSVVILSFYNNLAKRFGKTLPEELIPILVPAATTIAANYGIHNLKGTAEPLLSSMPTIITAAIGFPLWHIRTRILELWKTIDDAFDEIDFSD